MVFTPLQFFLLAVSVVNVTSFSLDPAKIELIDKNVDFCEGTGRRDLLTKFVSVASIACVPDRVYAVERAVGSSEKSCREDSNCLEKFDLDGAIGWNWGGKDRCDA